MKRLRLEKRGIRGLAVAEAFSSRSETSVLSGVVMRTDFVIDGFVFERATLGGDDATGAILSMFERLGRNDINYLLVSGMVLSLYNVVDIGRLCGQLGMPVIGVSYRETGNLERRMRSCSFPPAKLDAYGKLGPRTPIRLRTGGELFVRVRGCSTRDAAKLLDCLTLQGSVPEPIRVSRILSNAALGRLSF